jgi:predicted RNA binding protein YcfA (HicA-like mRNA interferase family)
MPPVPSVRGERVVRTLERAGFKVARVAGSRHIMRHPDGRGTTVPVHPGRDLAKARSEISSPTWESPSKICHRSSSVRHSSAPMRLPRCHPDALIRLMVVSLIVGVAA